MVCMAVILTFRIAIVSTRRSCGKTWMKDGRDVCHNEPFKFFQADTSEEDTAMLRAIELMAKRG